MSFEIANPGTGDSDKVLNALSRKNEADHQKGVLAGASGMQDEGGDAKSKLAGGLVKALFGGKGGAAL